jgi:hypothetical protein
VSSLVRQLVESSVAPSMFGEPRETELKGLSGAHTVFAGAWSSPLAGIASAVDRKAVMLPSGQCTALAERP